MSSLEIAVVFTSQVVVTDLDGEPYAEVHETMNTPFTGPGAKRRALNFLRSERDRDFTEADGWQWHLWANEPALEAYAEWATDQVLGRSSENH